MHSNEIRRRFLQFFADRGHTIVKSSSLIPAQDPTLLFVYAAAFPEQTLYLFAVIPIGVRWLAFVAGGMFVYGAATGATANVPILGGAIAGYVFYLLHRVPAPLLEGENADGPKAPSSDMSAVRNAARFVARIFSSVATAITHA